MNRKIFILRLISFIIFILFSNSDAYDNKTTHRDITKTAALPLQSNLDTYLKRNLGIPAGIDEKIRGKKIIDWFADGSEYEDDDNADSFSLLPQCRAVNHFHDPLKSWDQSYMTDQPWYVDVWCWDWKPIYSNITWATSYLSPPPDGAKVPFTYSSSMSPYNWDRARDYYYKALTLTTEEDREIYLAWTFQTVGHVIHLLEDMAVPAHTRNDFQSHLIKNNNSFFDRIQPFEHYVKNHPSLITNAQSDFPSFTNLKLTDFWDTDQYVVGSNPLTSLSIGLAEFSNANYFSDFTIPNNNPTPEHTFPYPSVNSSNYHICYDLAPDSIYEWDRKYISRKDKDGGVCPEPSVQRNADHFVAVSLLNEENVITNDNISSLTLWLDDNVHNTYAKDILPRAVGYSAGLLDYFFRGKINIVQTGTDTFQIINLSDEDMEGNLSSFKLYYDNINDERIEIPLAFYDELGTQYTDPDTVLSIPAQTKSLFKAELQSLPVNPKSPGEYMLVYKGRLGSEGAAPYDTDYAVAAQKITPVELQNKQNPKAANHSE